MYGGGFRLDNRQRSADNFGRCFPHSRDMRWRSPKRKNDWHQRENADLMRIGREILLG